MIEYAADEPQARSCIFEVVSQLTRLTAQRLPVTAASPLCRTSQASEERPFADQVCTTVSACLQQGFRRLLLVPLLLLTLPAGLLAASGWTSFPGDAFASMLTTADLLGCWLAGAFLAVLITTAEAIYATLKLGRTTANIR